MDDSVTVEYDSVYPPLNKPCTEMDECEWSKQLRSSIGMALPLSNKGRNNKNIFINSFDRRYKDNDPGFETTLKTLATKLGVDINATITNKGDLTISLKKKDKNVDGEQAKFLIAEALTHQIYKTFKINEKNIKKFADRRYQERLCRNLSATIRVDFNKSVVVVEGGPQSVRKLVLEIESFINWNTDVETIEMPIKCWFYDFIRGAKGEHIKELVRLAGKYVEIKFESEEKNSITLSGNRACVEKASELINRLTESYKDYKYAYYELNNSRKEKILQIFNEKTILEEHGVSLTILKKDECLYACHICGEETKFNVVNNTIKEICDKIKYKRIDCPYWICRFLLFYGDIRESVFKDIEDISITILASIKRVEISSSDKDLTQGVKKMKSIIDDISKSTSYKIYNPDEILLKFLEEKNSYRLKEIEARTATIICYEKFDTSTDLSLSSSELEIYIIGQKKQVELAYQLIEEHHKFISSFRAIEMEIPFYLHKYIIGAKGRNLKDMIDRHGKNCSASFSKDNILPDRCIIKGPECELNQFISALENKCNELKQIHKMYKVEVTDNNLHAIFLNDRKNIITYITKFGQIEYIDYFEDEAKVIKCIGRKEVIDKVKDYIDNKIQEYSKSVTREMFICDKMIPYYSNFSEEIIKVICDKVGNGISIKLPKTITSKDKIILFGPISAIENAMTIIKAFNTCNHKQHYMEMMKIPQIHTSHLKNTIFKSLGPNGVTVFCHSSPKNDESSLLIVGENSEVKRVKNDILKEVHLLQNTIERTFAIKSEYKKEFLKKKKDEATLVQRLSAENGNVRINIGEKYSNNNELINITLKGHKEYVDKLELVIKDMIKKFEQRIEAKHNFKYVELYSILTVNKYLLKNTMEKYNVVLSISENYYQSRSNNENEICYIRIKGFPNDVQQALEYIKDWKFIKTTIEVTKLIQQIIYSKQNTYYNTLCFNMCVQLEFGINKVPKTDQMTISGLEKNVNDALLFIQQICDDNYEIRLDVPNKYFTRLIGKQGINIKKFNSENNVRVYFPDDTSIDKMVIIYGNKSNCLIASDKIKTQVNEWESSITHEFSFDSRAKQKLFSTDPTLLRKIMTQFKTNMKFLTFDSKTPEIRTVSISGTAQNVQNCILYLQDLIDSTMEEIDEEYMYHPPRSDAYMFDMSALSSLVFPQSTNGTNVQNNHSPRSATINGKGSQLHKSSNNGSQSHQAATTSKSNKSPEITTTSKVSQLTEPTVIGEDIQLPQSTPIPQNNINDVSSNGDISQKNE